MSLRTSEIYMNAHENFGYHQQTQEHLAFEQGANWSDHHPSNETILKIIKAASIVKANEFIHSNYLIDNEPYPFFNEDFIQKVKTEFKKL